MDGVRFDRLVREWRQSGTRRGVLRLLAGLPFGGTMALLLGSVPSTAERRKKRHGGGKQRKGKGRGGHKDQGQGKAKRRGDGKTKARAEQVPSNCFTGSPCTPGPGKNLGKCDFGGSSALQGKNLKGANLGGANLAGADASGADLSGANLDKTCLVDANLTGATINGSTNFGTAIFCRTTMPDGSLNNSGCGKGTKCCPTCDAAHPCPAGEVCCDGRCRSGNCCTDAQCPSGVCCARVCCAANQVCDTRPTPDVCCSPQTPQQTCEGQCGEVVNNCGQTVDCGPCRQCDVCPQGCDSATVQEAVDAAGPGDTITVCPGLYVGDVAIDFDGELTIVGAGPGSDPGTDTILQGTGAGSVVTVSGGTVRIEALRVTGGMNPENSYGGGIYNESATLELVDCTVIGNVNEFGWGAGVANNGGTLTVTGCTITENTAADLGGGLYTEAGNLAVSDSFVTNNGAESGGGIFFWSGAGTMTVDTCTITGNTASSGGGVYLEDAEVEITGCDISSNTTDGDGGGIYFGAGTLSLADCTINDNTISMTTENFGGAIYNDGSDLTLTICEVRRNSAPIGGGIANFGTTMLDGCTFTNNHAVGTGNDGGGGALYNNSKQDLSLTNCIVRLNIADQFGGGIVNFGEVTLDGTTVTENSAGTDGGGIYNGFGGFGVPGTGTSTCTGGSSVSGNTNGDCVAVDGGDCDAC